MIRKPFFKLFYQVYLQGSGLGRVIFNIFTNDVLLFINKVELASFVDNNILDMTSKKLTKCLDTFQGYCETAINNHKL